MNNKDINLMRLETVASSLGGLLPEVTFVGGSTTILLVDESAHFGVRKTDDVDVIADITTLVEYHEFGKALRELGYQEDINGPICRWSLDSDGGVVTLDVMIACLNLSSH